MNDPKVKTEDDVRRELLEIKVSEMTIAETCWSSAREAWEAGNRDEAKAQEARANAAECRAMVAGYRIDLLDLDASEHGASVQSRLAALENKTGLL